MSTYTDTHSAKSWVTHTTSVKNPEDLEKIDMLPSIKNRVFCTPEWAPIFTLREDDFRASLGIITRIADSKNEMKKEEVKIVQRWDGIRPSIKPLLFRFDVYLLVSKSKEKHKRTKQKKSNNQEPKMFSTWRRK